MPFFPIVPLPKQFYNPNLARDAPATLDYPARSKRLWVSIVFDWVLIAAMFAVIQYLYVGPQPSLAYFSLDDESLNHPEVPEIISSTTATLINAVVPIILLGVLELVFWFNIWDAYHMVKGHAESIAIALFFTSLFWIVIGGAVGLRPTFLTKCHPNPVLVISSQAYYTPAICMNDLPKFEFQGFPSGHSSTAFAGWGYFVLYLHGKLKPFVGGGGYLWKAILMLSPLAFAVWISMTRVLDYRHFPYQIIVGGIVGGIASLVAYRLNFGGPLDWFIGSGGGSDHIPVRYTHLPLEERDVEETGQSETEVRSRNTLIPTEV